MSNVFSDYTEEQLAYGLPKDLKPCDGMSALWHKTCCGRFVCMEDARPFGSARCHEALADYRCVYNPQPRAN